MESKNVQAAIWLIGLGILFLTGDIWPGILILIGLSMIVSAYLKNEPAAAPPPTPAAPAEPEEMAEDKPAESPAEEPLPPALASEGERLFLSSRLPEKCPACDAPMKANAENLAWHEDKTFACMFCGYRVEV